MKIVSPTPENVALAAAALVHGELVGMPTETVYGLACDALNTSAVARVFEVKGRPADNPLIVHLSSADQVLTVAAAFPPEAQELALRYWPGPLSLVLPKLPSVPDSVTGGLDTVAVRVPAHPVARALISAARRPVAAPSANRFMGLSPTRASDIDLSVGDRLALVLDGGPCGIGLESTVVDCTSTPFRLLRPGVLSIEGLAVGGPERRSPGMHPRHYSPRAPLRLAHRLSASDAGVWLSEVCGDNQVRLPADPTGYAAGLYVALHELDRRGLAEIVVERPPDGPIWSAVWDRLVRAAGSD